MDKNIVEVVVAALIAVIGLIAALVPLYRISRRTEADVKLAKFHASAANDAVNQTHPDHPRLADNVLSLVAQSEKHKTAIKAMQDELKLIRSEVTDTLKHLKSVNMVCQMRDSQDGECE